MGPALSPGDAVHETAALAWGKQGALFMPCSRPPAGVWLTVQLGNGAAKEELLAMRQRNHAAAQPPDSFRPPEVILPSQFFGKRHFTCEQRLMLAVLADAINILHDRRASLSMQKRQLLSEAVRWVMTHGSNVPFSFDNVCDALEINREALRRRLTRMIDDSGTDSCWPLARLRLRHAGRLQHMTVNRSRRLKSRAPARDARAR